MRKVITGFLNQEKLTFDEYIKRVKTLRINQISLSHFNKKPLSEINKDDFKELQDTIRKEKLRIYLMKVEHEWLNISDEDTHIEALGNLETVVKHAVKLKAEGIVFKAPFIDDAIKEAEFIQTQFKPFFDLAIKARLEFYLEPHQNQTSNTYAYLFKKHKWDIQKIVFIPEYMLKNNESTTTNYRILKPFMGLLYVNDFDFELKPQLIGFGKTDILKILKRIKRDNLSVSYLIDTKFEQMYYSEKPKQSFLQKFFRKKDKSKAELTEMQARLFPNDQEKNVTYSDILENQIKVIEKLIR
ncbi:MAG: hypothetical protein WC964_01330 [Acholeplasmataceae bacterium]